MVIYCNFHNSSFFLKIFFHVNGMAKVTHRKDGNGKNLVAIGLVIENFWSP
jgi:hypothetical protein